MDTVGVSSSLGGLEAWEKTILPPSYENVALLNPVKHEFSLKIDKKTAVMSHKELVLPPDQGQ